MRASEFVTEDISRRGFLGGLAGLAALGQTRSTPPTPASQPTPKVTQPQKFQYLGKNPKMESLILQSAKAAGIQGVELAQFMAQVKHESWDFTRLTEKPQSKNYFSRMYDKKFSPRIAKLLGNVKVGDGETFHGRGFIQLTGRDKYTRAEKALGLPLLQQPELAAVPENAVKIAIWYWMRFVRPKVTDFSDTATVTRPINKGLRGLDDRHRNFLKYLSMIQPQDTLR